MYGTRIRISRVDAADMMSATTWMDANEAFERGFVDGVTETPAKLSTDSTGHNTSLETAKAGVQAWFDRKTKSFSVERKHQQVPEPACAADAERAPGPVPDNRVKVVTTDTRLEHLRF